MANEDFMVATEGTVRSSLTGIGLVMRSPPLRVVVLEEAAVRTLRSMFAMLNVGVAH